MGIFYKDYKGKIKIDLFDKYGIRKEEKAYKKALKQAKKKKRKSK